jgi:hypothetical protein
MTDAELFDASDVEFSIETSKSGREVRCVFKSESAFNLMKLYLALKEQVDKIEHEMGIFAPADGEH